MTIQEKKAPVVTGAVVNLSATGADEQDAVEALEALLQRDVY